jgi:hypothetical protein
MICFGGFTCSRTLIFPQYDRADLLRELRARRSAEAVAESILLGIFSGIPRGGGGVDM